jgi:ribosomal protein S6--L-glutamate ligase
MKIALFYRVWFDSGEEILAAAKKLGIELEAINYNDLVLRQSGGSFEIFYQAKPLSRYRLFYFRAVGGAVEWANLLVLYAQKKGIPIIDDYLAVWGPIRRLKSISGVILAQEGVAYPKTSLAVNQEKLLKEVKQFSFPLVLKISKGGRHGIGTLLCKDRQTLLRIIKGRIEKSAFLVQEYIPNDGDYRLFLIGYQVLGGFKRQKKEEKLMLNRSLGPSEKIERIPAEVGDLAQKAAQVLKVEISAIDLVVDKRSKKPVIIEVNEAPQFRVFQKRTGVDVAQKIVEYLVKKAEAGLKPAKP